MPPISRPRNLQFYCWHRNCSHLLTLEEERRLLEVMARKQLLPFKDNLSHILPQCQPLKCGIINSDLPSMLMARPYTLWH